MIANNKTCSCSKFLQVALYQINDFHPFIYRSSKLLWDFVPIFVPQVKILWIMIIIYLNSCNKPKTRGPSFVLSLSFFLTLKKNNYQQWRVINETITFLLFSHFAVHLLNMDRIFTVEAVLIEIFIWHRPSIYFSI